MPTPFARASLLVLASALPCCFPWPHFETSAPAMDGVLLAEGRPVAGVSLRLAANPGPDERGCPAGSAEATTDAQGRFFLPAPRRFSPVVDIGHREDTWRLCILGHAGGVREGSGLSGGPQGERLMCELGAPGGPSRALLPLPSISGALAERGCWVRPVDHPLLPGAP